MRRKLIAGNWKMHGSRESSRALLQEIKRGAQTLSNVDLLVIPSFVHLSLAQEILTESAVQLGAQNMYLGESGAFTGEISGAMLTDYGCQYVLIGHSERRQIFMEDLPLVAAKFKAAVSQGLKPILCLGETQAQREHHLTEKIIREQLESVIEASGIDLFKQAVIAYEPVWAIGTGLTATPEQAQSVHAFIRAQLERHDPSIAKNMQILYGGSVKADNASSLLTMPDIDGGLVGGASLNAKSFLEIAQAAEG